MSHSLYLEFTTFLDAIDNSLFNVDIGASGGYLTFANSGKRGTVKSFTLSLETFLKGFEDIKNNLDIFQRNTAYVEQSWRDIGAQYFSDLTLNSMITVQTKPTFTTFSKIISWANDEKYTDDNNINISLVSIDTTISKLRLLIEEYRPKNTKQVSDRGSLLALPKPFLLLAGLSGTGKSRFVREQAAASGSLAETYTLISVRPDWHEPSDLLGYISRLKNGDAQYIVTEALRFMVAAWCEAWDSAELTDTNYLPIKSPAEIRPYWLCLDEMNLAPVEQYFADYLSVIETRKWEEGVYSCDPILKAETILQLEPLSQNKLRADLGIDAASYDSLWAFFIAKGKGIPLPPNLIVAGTVNMDETTHGFSRKVIDRALSFDFGEFFPNDFDYFFSANTQNLALTYPLWSDARKSLAELSTTFDGDGTLTVTFMKAVNAVLDNTPFKLAYRALNEILLSVIASSPQDERDLMAVWDDFIMCKVLPRIEGDADKLALLNSEGAGDQSLLTELLRVLAEQLQPIWQGKVRPDLYRKYNEEKTNLPVGVEDTAENRKIIWIECRSKNKLVWMQQRLTNATFTSFWP